MPTPINLSTLLAQMPHVAQLKSVANAHPEAQQGMLGQHVAALQKKEWRKIQQIQKKQGSASVDKDRNPDEKPRQVFSGHRRRSEEDDQGFDSTPSPWSGNIINLEI